MDSLRVVGKRCGLCLDSRECWVCDGTGAGAHASRTCQRCEGTGVCPYCPEQVIDLRGIPEQARPGDA